MGFTTALDTQSDIDDDDGGGVVVWTGQSDIVDQINRTDRPYNNTVVCSWSQLICNECDCAKYMLLDETTQSILGFTVNPIHGLNFRIQIRGQIHREKYAISQSLLLKMSIESLAKIRRLYRSAEQRKRATSFHVQGNWRGRRKISRENEKCFFTSFAGCTSSSVPGCGSLPARLPAWREEFSG